MKRILQTVGVIAVLLYIGHLFSPSSTTPPSTKQSADDPPRWLYDSEVDEMSSTKTVTATLNSTNKLNFSFPYNGGSQGSITLRHRKGKNDAILRVSQGQFVCGVESCFVHVKFDNQPVQTFEAIEPSDSKAGVLFITPYSRFLSGIRKATTMKIEATYFEQGDEVLNFQIPPLDWK